MTKSQSVAVLPQKVTKSGRQMTSTVQPSPKKIKRAKNNFATPAAKRPQKVDIQNTYDVDTGFTATKTRTRSALMTASKTTRNNNLSQSMAATGADIGPGAYDGGKTFGKDVVGFSWGKPKPAKKIEDPRDYNWPSEGGVTATRHRSPSALINKEGRRPTTFADQTKADFAGPGHYKESKNFGEGVKGF